MVNIKNLKVDLKYQHFVPTNTSQCTPILTETSQKTL